MARKTEGTRGALGMASYRAGLVLAPVSPGPPVPPPPDLLIPIENRVKQFLAECLSGRA